MREKQGLLAPSTQAPGINLVLWHQNEADGAAVGYLDPLWGLPRDQASWQATRGA